MRSIRIGDGKLSPDLAAGEGRRVDIYVRLAADDCLQCVRERVYADFRTRVKRRAVVHAEVQGEVAGHPAANGKVDYKGSVTPFGAIWMCEAVEPVGRLKTRI